MDNILIGIVKSGVFELVYPENRPFSCFRLTSTRIQDSVPPENGELNLVEYEENAIAVSGNVNREWIYSASIVDTGDPIVTALVRKVFAS